MLAAIRKFREWAKVIPVASRSGEWECDYPNWTEIYSHFEDFLKFKDFHSWTTEEISEILYIIGRDNECGILAELAGTEIARLKWLLQKCLKSIESAAKWQLIIEAGELPEWNHDLEELVYRLYFDKDYYVQRRALMELAKKKSKYTLELAEYSWATGDEYQRISVLQALHDIDFEGISTFLNVALKSDKKYLVLAAERITKDRGST